MKDSIRAFIAITLSTEVRDALGKVSAGLAAQLPPGSVRWVKPDRMHLTLRFLGDTAVSLVDELAGGLDNAVQMRPPFTLRLGELGCFPNTNRPRVIWASLNGDIAALQEMKLQIDEMLVPLGWSRESRPFRGHVTLGRVKDSRKLRGMSWAVEVEKLVVPVTAVHLIESQLRPSGPIYSLRHAATLQGQPQP